MNSTTFDTLEYFEKLKAAGAPEAQAKVQAEAMRGLAEANAAAIQEALNKYDETTRKEIATKGDIQDVNLEIEKVRAEIEKVRAELKTEIEKTKYALLKWQFGIALALALIMARGFGWIGI